MLSDLRFALRQLVKSPGFTATVVLTLALGIGACTVVFTVVKATLLDIVKGADFDRIVLVHETQLPQRPQLQLSPPTFLDLEREAKSFEFLSAWTGGTLNLSGDGEPQRLSVASVTQHTFAAWSMQPALGRGFLPEEFTPGKEKVVVLSFGLWQRSFGGARDVIGRKVLFDGEPFTVVGVLADQFKQLGSDLEAFVPLVFSDQQRTQQRGAHYLQVTGRLKPGVTLEQAQAELNVFATRLAAHYPDTNKGGGLLVRNFSAYINRSLAPMLHILLGVVGCVLLVACANVANLLLARATTRQKEIAVRAALGASRTQIIRQLLIESIVLALAGGAAGVLLAQWGLQFVRTFAPGAGTDFARLAFVELDGRMLGFALLFSVATGIAFGLAPAWLTSRVDLNDALKQGTRGSTEGGARGRLRNALAALEIALALLLLTGAGLLIRSFVQLAHIDPGFTPEHVASARIFLRTQKYRTPEQRAAFVDALLERLRGLPGAEAAALTTTLPFNSPTGFAFAVADRPFDSASNLPSAAPYLITGDYFRALGIRLLRGRGFTDRDNSSAPVVVIINETLARQFFPNEDAIGRQLRFPNTLPNVAAEIVGVVGDTIQGGPGTPPSPQIYLAWRQFAAPTLTPVVRTSGDPGAALAALKSQVYAIDPSQPVFGARTLEDLFGDTLARQRLMLRLLVAFAGIALVIAAVGLYGVMAYSVGQRTTEFGIRMALGAGSRDIVWQVLRQGLKVVAIGIAIGLVAALALGRLVATWLYQTNPRDPVTLGLIAFLLAAVAILACLLPARRATKVDPMVALRAE
jgi:putative ABC transport system permease protein